MTIFDRALVCMAFVVLAVGWWILADAFTKVREQAEQIEVTTERNEWGQLRHTPEFMCEASIRQWLEECK